MGSAISARHPDGVTSTEKKAHALGKPTCASEIDIIESTTSILAKPYHTCGNSSSMLWVVFTGRMPSEIRVAKRESKANDHQRRRELMDISTTRGESIVEYKGYYYCVRGGGYVVVGEVAPHFTQCRMSKRMRLWTSSSLYA